MTEEDKSEEQLDRGPQKGAREGLRCTFLECREKGGMHVGGTSLTTDFAKRRFWFVISLVKSSGILCSLLERNILLVCLFWFYT